MNYDYLAKMSFSVGIYIRLSQEDRDKKYETDSESVINQKEILRNYVLANGFHLYKEYVDDGFTGTNFDRPAFEEMLEDIKNKKINMVVVKDLSRLGRDHVMTGYYIETYFPENGVRFVSLVENYDSMKNQASNDSSTFIIACNDYYSKQNSLKIRNVLDSKRKDGKFIGSAPSYGYKRDPEDKGHLIPDKKTAKYVKLIFKWRLEGKGLSEIADLLTDLGAPTPSAYKDIKISARLKNKDKWTISSVKKILLNRIYVGDMVQHKQTNLNYKSKKKKNLDPSLWIVVENTHQPLISREDFLLAEQLRMKHARVYESKYKRENRLLDGIVYCKECGNRIGITYRKEKDYWTMNCNRYAREPRKRFCSPHFYPYEYFEEQFIRNLKNSLNELFANLNIKDLNNEIVKITNNTPSSLETQKMNLEKEKDGINLIIQKMYQDRLEGTISVESFKNLVAPYERKLEDIAQRTLDIDIELARRKNNRDKIPDYTKKIKKLLNMDNPDRDLVLSLIYKIEVDENKLVTLKFKNNFLNDYTYQYIEEHKIRNPYGRKGKKIRD